MLCVCRTPLHVGRQLVVDNQFQFPMESQTCTNKLRVYSTVLLHTHAEGTHPALPYCLGRPEIRKSASKAHKPFRGSMIHLSTHRISNSTTAVCNVHICLDEHTFKLYKHTPLFKRLEKHIRIILSVLAFKQTYIQLVDKSTKVHHLHMHTHQIHVFKFNL